MIRAIAPVLALAIGGGLFAAGAAAQEDCGTRLVVAGEVGALDTVRFGTVLSRRAEALDGSARMTEQGRFAVDLPPGTTAQDALDRGLLAPGLVSIHLVDPSGDGVIAPPLAEGMVLSDGSIEADGSLWFRFDGAGRDTLADVTGENLGETIEVRVDGTPVIAAQVREVIAGGALGVSGAAATDVGLSAVGGSLVGRGTDLPPELAVVSEGPAPCADGTE